MRRIIALCLAMCLFGTAFATEEDANGWNDEMLQKLADIMNVHNVHNDAPDAAARHLLQNGRRTPVQSTAIPAQIPPVQQGFPPLQGNPAGIAIAPYKFQSMMSTMQNINYWGYPLEEYDVPTPDGWTLKLYRIPAGLYRNKDRNKKKPLIMLYHGITLSSACYTLLNANESLAYILADAGFDVWLPNARENVYSRKYDKAPFTQAEYWYTSIDEQALIDVPTQIDFALKTAGAKKTAFVGHSQGCTLAYFALAAIPSMNDKISVVLQMGPVAFVELFQSWFLKNQGMTNSVKFLKDAELGEFITTRSISLLTPSCNTYNSDEFCINWLYQTFYGPSKFITPDDALIIAQTWPAGVSTRNLEHWAQMLQSPELRLQRYDFGNNCSMSPPKPYYETCNLREYGTTVPPEYDLGKIRAPIVFILGYLDVMSTGADVNEQISRLGSAYKGAFFYPEYGHMDFVWDRNARHALDIADVAFRFSAGTF